MERIEYRLMHELEGDFWWYRALHAAVMQRLDHLQLPTGSAVLDAGCGTGGLLQHLARTRPQWRYHGLEFDAEAAQLAQQKSGVAVTRGSVNVMPFADQQFAAILSQDVLYHRNVDERAMLAECFRCLQPGGQLLLQVAAYQWLASAHDEHVHGARRYTAGRLRQLLQQAGFVVTAAGYWNSLLFPLMVLQRLVLGRNKADSDVQTIPVWQNRLLFAVLDAERQLPLPWPFGGSVWIQGRKPQ